MICNAERPIHVWKNNHLSHAKCLLCKLKLWESEMLWFFSNEVNFDQNQKVNYKNDRWLLKGPKDVPTVMHIKFLSAHLFLQGLRVNATDVKESFEALYRECEKRKIVHLCFVLLIVVTDLINNYWILFFLFQSQVKDFLDKKKNGDLLMQKRAAVIENILKKVNKI